MVRGRSVTAAVTAAAAVGAAARGRLRNWGARPGEVHGRYPGDELLPGPVSSTTYAITVAAPAESVWSWLVQIGQGRGGMYSYEWLENLFGLDIHNAEEVRPEWQLLTAGDRVRVVPPGKLGMPNGYAFRVAVVDPPRALVLRQQPPEHPWDATWAFLIVPEGSGRCRLLSRSRSARVSGGAGLAALAAEELMRPVILIMTRRMLLGIKERAEQRRPLTPFGESRVDGPGSSSQRSSALEEGSASVDVYWLPLGAGGHFVRWNGRIFEAIAARLRHRGRADLYHSALEVRLGLDHYVIEQGPVWNLQQPDRGVVCEGPVGSPWLGRSRLFRYEVRRWLDGVIPDIAEAVDSPQRVSADRLRAQEVLDLVPTFPTATWGRDEQHTGEMWNSNSLISWLLARSGHDTSALHPPRGGRAPGWTAGLVLAAREQSGAGTTAARGKTETLP
jgi:hypothetical protein